VKTPGSRGVFTIVTIVTTVTNHASPLTLFLTLTAGSPGGNSVDGPTASGKTGVVRNWRSTYLWKSSAWIPRWCIAMDIGTAKPHLTTRLKVLHHLIDLVDPTEGYSAAQFCEDALRR
jgi:tRNA dimethylallyltransferase